MNPLQSILWGIHKQSNCIVSADDKICRLYLAADSTSGLQIWACISIQRPGTEVSGLNSSQHQFRADNWIYRAELQTHAVPNRSRHMAHMHPQSNPWHPQALWREQQQVQYTTSTNNNTTTCSTRHAESQRRLLLQRHGICIAQIWFQETPSKHPHPPVCTWCAMSEYLPAFDVAWMTHCGPLVSGNYTRIFGNQAMWTNQLA